MDIIVFACAEVDVCLTLLTSRARIITFKDHSVFWNIARGEGFCKDMCWTKYERDKYQKVHNRALILF